MGYEVKIYVGEKTEGMREKDADYFMVAAMIDVCKPGYESKIYALCSETSKDEKYPAVRAYLRNVNECDFTDRYGKTLRALPLDLVLDAVTQDMATDEYRRFPIAADVLSTFKKNFGGNRLAVVLYGY